MKLEVGKSYVTRGGRDIYEVIAENKYVPSGSSWRFIAVSPKSGEERQYSEEGRFIPGRLEDSDLVKEYAEPRTFTRCIAIIMHPPSSDVYCNMFEDAEAAKEYVQCLGGTLLALKEITLTEGEGL